MGTPQPEQHELLLDESLVEWTAYWDARGPLTAALERRKAWEYKVRCEFAARGLKPLPWVADEIRSGKAERIRNRSLRNLVRNRAILARLRRQGYTFDAEHRLVA